MEVNMYPNEILPGIDMYVIMLCAAAISAILVFRILADKLGLGARLQNLCLFNAVASIMAGYYSAVLFQAVYNIPKYNEFRLDSATGATFYGGLIGGAAFFLAVYFMVGARMFAQSGEHIHNLRAVTDIGAACIAVAHGLGRIGCLMAGCCHGAQTDAWYGIYMASINKRVVPIQLFEALVLFLLFAWLFYRVLKGKTYNLPLYMATYGVWRFVIEYARDDYRGYTFISFLTPSQLTAIAMIVGAAVVFVFMRISFKKSQHMEEK